MFNKPRLSAPVLLKRNNSNYPNIQQTKPCRTKQLYKHILQAQRLTRLIWQGIWHVTTGLTNSDDAPEHYRAWRASFINVMNPPGPSPGEQMDLMVKWLGKESSDHAVRIGATNANQPNVGLESIWSRPDKMFGSPEATEKNLFSRAEAFPKIQSRDSSNLQELADLRQELEVAKQEVCGFGHSWGCTTGCGEAPSASSGALDVTSFLSLSHLFPSSKNLSAEKLRKGMILLIDWLI